MRPIAQSPGSSSSPVASVIRGTGLARTCGALWPGLNPYLERNRCRGVVHRENYAIHAGAGMRSSGSLVKGGPMRDLRSGVIALDELRLYGAAGGCRPRGDIQFVVDRAEMLTDRTRTDEERLRNGRVGIALRYQP